MTHDNHGTGHDDGGSHAHHSDDVACVSFGLLTVSSSRTRETDESGDAIVDAIESAGHTVHVRDLVTDDADAIRDSVRTFRDDEGVDAIVTTGGTGVTTDDVTPDALDPLFDREIPGFGEQFRARSIDRVGPHGLLTRAKAGIVDGVPVFCLPGSEAAADFGANELVAPVVGHVVGLVDSSGDRHDGTDAGGRDTRGGEREGTDENLTHVDDEGAAHMVDVGGKADSERRAVARGRIHLQSPTVDAIRENRVEKGDVLATARTGAIQAVKHTWETIPLCHQIPVTNVDTEFSLDDRAVELTVTVETVAPTGCEMEALEGVTTGLNVVWDMVKAMEKDDEGQYPETAIEDVRVLEKVKA